jgi:hypothetical protein
LEGPAALPGLPVSDYTASHPRKHSPSSLLHSGGCADTYLAVLGSGVVTTSLCRALSRRVPAATRGPLCDAFPWVLAVGAAFAHGSSPSHLPLKHDRPRYRGLITHREVRKYGGVEVKLHAFTTSALCGGEWWVPSWVGPKTGLNCLLICIPLSHTSPTNVHVPLLICYTSLSHISHECSCSPAHLLYLSPSLIFTTATRVHCIYGHEGADSFSTSRNSLTTAGGFATAVEDRTCSPQE